MFNDDNEPLRSTAPGHPDTGCEHLALGCSFHAEATHKEDPDGLRLSVQNVVTAGVVFDAVADDWRGQRQSNWASRQPSARRFSRACCRQPGLPWQTSSSSRLELKRLGTRSGSAPGILHSFGALHPDSPVEQRWQFLSAVLGCGRGQHRRCKLSSARSGHHQHPVQINTRRAPATLTLKWAAVTGGPTMAGLRVYRSSSAIAAGIERRAIFGRA